MPAFTTIVNALVAVGAKPFATTMQAFRDNPIAIAEGDPTAPVVASAWHPFNKVTNGDANTGQIWGFTANGAVAAVTSPDFADGWDYGFLFQDVSVAVSLRINLWRETSGAYAGPVAMGAATGVVSGFVELPFCRRVLSSQSANFSLGDSVAIRAPGNAGIPCSPSQKILRAQFSAGSGNIGGTASSFIYMYRKRSV